MTPAQALERLFTTLKIEADWFTPDFLAAIPVSVEQVITGLTAQLGNYQGLVESADHFTVQFERGSATARIALTQTGQISGLLFQSIQQKTATLDEAMQRFEQLPGEVSLVVRAGQTELMSWNPSLPLAVGSTFKLAVLKALRDQIEAGQHTWDEVVPLQANWKSLPSGILQNWPEGSLLTVQSLAALMISQSDNTATDHLINRVGRSAIESLTLRNRPFLTTREFFTLKSQNRATWLQQYRDGNAIQRRQLLEDLQPLALPKPEEFDTAPKAIDVEWFFTANELCDLMEQVQDLPLMSINPGVADPSDWQRVAYKGGSEAGVLNLTTYLVSQTDRPYCVSATWNHTEPLDEMAFFTHYTSLLGVLKQSV